MPACRLIAVVVIPLPFFQGVASNPGGPLGLPGAVPAADPGQSGGGRGQEAGHPSLGQGCCHGGVLLQPPGCDQGCRPLG